MKKSVLIEKTESIKSDTKEALQTVFDTLNLGQRNKIIKNEKVKELFDRYGVDY